MPNATHQQHNEEHVFQERMLEIQRQVMDETMTHQQRMMNLMHQMNRIALRRHQQPESSSLASAVSGIEGSRETSIADACGRNAEFTTGSGTNQENIPDGFHHAGAETLLSTTREIPVAPALSEAAVTSDLLTAAAKELTHRERYVLPIYLRDYYSQYHIPKNLKIGPRFQSFSRCDLKSILNYWTEVETLSRTNTADTTAGSATQGISNQRCRRHHQPVACQLSWPRAGIQVDENSLSSDGTLVDLQPHSYALSIFRGEICTPTTCPSEHFSRLMNLTSFQYLTVYSPDAIIACQPSTITDAAFVHFTNLKSLKLLDGCNQVTDEAFRHLRSLQSLELSTRSDPTPITDEAFCHLTNLQSLTINDSINPPIRFTDEALCHLTNLRSLFMFSYALETSMRNEAFRNLSNLTSLKMTLGIQITDEAFYHLQQLQSLSLYPSLFSAPTVVIDEAFRHLTNLRYLAVGNCSQITMTGEAFRHLTNLHFLDMSNCRHTTITDACFRYLTRLTVLKMNSCNQTTITDEGFRHLPNLIFLDMSLCDQGTITNEAFRHLKSLKFLGSLSCSQIADEAFVHLRDLHSLTIGTFRCNHLIQWYKQPIPITDEAFRHLSNLRFLTMIECNQTTITDVGFRHLRSLQSLNMLQCYQSTITDEAFRHLTSLRSLSVDDCGQATITKEALNHLTNLHSFEVDGHDQTKELVRFVGTCME